MENDIIINSRPILIQVFEQTPLKIRGDGQFPASWHGQRDFVDRTFIGNAERDGLLTKENVLALLPYALEHQETAALEAVVHITTLAAKKNADLALALLGKLIAPLFYEKIRFQRMYSNWIGEVAREIVSSKRKHPALYSESLDGSPNWDVFLVKIADMPIVFFRDHCQYKGLLPGNIFSTCISVIKKDKNAGKKRLNTALRLLFAHTVDEVNKAMDEMHTKPDFEKGVVAIDQWQKLVKGIEKYPKLKKELKPGVCKKLWPDQAPSQG